MLRGRILPNYCSMTRLPISGLSDAVWDDGEWISWDWINGELHEQELEGQFPNADPDLVRVFEDIVSVAAAYRDVSGRYLPVFGELGEIFAEISFGIERHSPRTQGSDGRMGIDLVEVKTITPEKNSQNVVVKRRGNFNKLIVVKISESFEFEARVLDRKNMSKGSGKFAKVSWSEMNPLKPDRRA